MPGVSLCEGGFAGEASSTIVFEFCYCIGCFNITILKLSLISLKSPLYFNSIKFEQGFNRIETWFHLLEDSKHAVGNRNTHSRQTS